MKKIKEMKEIEKKEGNGRYSYVNNVSIFIVLTLLCAV